MVAIGMTRRLAYAGALPFLACALLPWLGVDAIPPLGALNNIAALYTLAIVSFMAGAHWGIALYQPSIAEPIHLFLSSNAVTITIWLAFLVTTPDITLLIGVLAFLYLLWIDYRLYRMHRITADYWQTRCHVTAGVVISLLLIIAGA
jgi:hypothetical protein